MKTIIIISIFLFEFGYLGYSQSIVIENKKWSFKGPSIITEYQMYYTKLKGDTLINSNTYKIIWAAVQWSPENWYRNVGFLREEDGKVYLNHYYIPSKEELLYDFNIREGEIFHHTESNIDCLVDSIRIKEISGENRKHIYLSYNGYIVQWVEGIGTLGYLLGSITPMIENGFELLCVHKDEHLIYHNTNYTGCDLNTAVQKPFVNTQIITLMPIISGEIRVQLNNEFAGEITFVTPDGKQVLKAALTQPETTLCAPTTGLLLYRFVSTTGEVQTGKILVK